MIASGIGGGEIERSSKSPIFDAFLYLYRRGWGSFAPARRHASKKLDWFAQRILCGNGKKDRCVDPHRGTNGHLALLNPEPRLRCPSAHSATKPNKISDVYPSESIPMTCCAEEDGLAYVREDVGVREPYAFVYDYELGQNVPTWATFSCIGTVDACTRTWPTSEHM